MRIKRIVILAISLMVLLSITTFAKETTFYGVTSSEDEYSAILSPNQPYSRNSIYSPKGNILSSGMVSISNIGGGRIGVYINTSCHQVVEKITMRVYLDSWNEANQLWEQEGYYDFEYHIKDYPDLSDATASFEILGMPTGKYYRLRGLHAVTDGELFEVLSSRTDGVLITR